MKFEQVCQPLNAYFAQHPVFRILLPLAIPLMLGCAGLNLLAFFISLGGVVNALVYLGFFLALLLVVSTCNFRMASVGLGLYALDYLLSMLRTLIKYHSMPYSSLIYCLVFGYLAFLAYRKSAILN